MVVLVAFSAGAQVDNTSPSESDEAVVSETSPQGNEAVDAENDAAPIPEDSSTDPIAESESPVAPEGDSRYGWDVIRQINPDGTALVDLSDSSSPSLLAEGEQTFQQALFRMLAGLSVVLALILMTYYLVRRYGKGIPALSGAQLGQVIGQLHLSRDAKLHYVRTGGRVLIVGVTPSGVNLVAEFGASTFDQSYSELDVEEPLSPDGFIEALKNQSTSYAEPPPESATSDGGDDDVAMLRSDIHRLQDYLREESRESKD
ncbi:FliO/MopB family protein [bacterium AH-315-P07]|nr:FliO/MopB family protein [bacterium AH-315-P07]